MPGAAGTLEEALAHSEAQLNNEGADSEDVSEKPEVEKAEAQETEETEKAEELEEQTESSDSDGDQFTNINPEELPDELKGVYKSLQADYTRKTQELAEQRKSSDSRVKKLEDKLSELEKAQQPDEDEDKKPSAQEQLKNFVRNEVKAEKITEYREQAVKDYESADPRLELDSDDYDQATDLYVGQQMDSLLKEHLDSGEPEYTFDHNKALKTVLGEWDEYLESKQRAYLEKQQKKAKEKAKKTQKQNPKTKTGKSKPKKPSLDEAIALAQQDA